MFTKCPVLLHGPSLSPHLQMRNLGLEMLNGEANVQRDSSTQALNLGYAAS